MKRRYRMCIGAFSLLLLVVLVLAGGISWLLWHCRDAGAGYCAKILASGVFVMGRTPESIRAQELKFVPACGYEVDLAAKSVTAWIFPSAKRTAVYRDGLGVALLLDDDVKRVQALARPALIPRLDALKDQPWPMGDAPSGKPRPEGFDEAKVTAAVDHMFAEPNRLHLRNTRAVIVAYRGEIIAERYAPGFGPEQRLAGWSMTKSVFHALYGIAVRDGKLKTTNLAPVPAWRTPGDPRGLITLDALLHMHSGIDYSDFDFDGRPRLAELLFGHQGAAEYFMSRPAAHAPGEHFAYASGGTNLLSWILRQAYGDDAYCALPYKELFDKLGMRSTILEADATGTFIGSSYLFATARDFVRFGLLYQNDGLWQGERILPEGWVQHGRTPADGGPDYYGAHWWLFSASDRERARKRGVIIPEDAFIATGYEGQKLLVIPSMQLVVARLGLCYFSDFPLADELSILLKAFPEAQVSDSDE